MPSGRVIDRHPTPHGQSFDIADGERSNFDQYCSAIGAARRSIYIEHQCITVPDIIARLEQALSRGVEALVILPAADKTVPAELLALSKYDNFTLAGIAGIGFDGKRKPVWVHAKLMIVDDEWFTAGSCNLHHASLFGNAELNIACWHPNTARALRNELLREHLDRDTSRMNDVAALQLFRLIAIENRTRFDAGEDDWQGLAFSLIHTHNNGRSAQSD